MQYSDKNINNESTYINNFIYNALTTTDRLNCINFYGNVKINNSSFFGSKSCLKNLISYNGENINSIEIENSIFNGAFLNTCLSLTSAFKSNIYLSLFEKGKSCKDGGYNIKIIIDN